ncbi:hypothetical protein ACH4SP_25845 [Streptomyces sp. NPDC021093]|uniref:hypothetical protein n=1 Tax=Streptomyces sp. NPDC021093 TaxID=3365112 RepID=UPI00379A181F
MATTQNLIPGLLGAGGLAQALAGAPPWCAISFLAVSLVLGITQALFPQNSRDRLTWWQNRRTYLHNRRDQRHAHRLPPGS